MMSRTGRIVPFPPLPPLQEAPRFPPDARQDVFRRITGGIAEAAGDRLGLAVANVSTGFPASAVDVGRLKAALETGVASFDMALVAERWDTDVAAWLSRTVLLWVQRCKAVSFRKFQTGIRVDLETQDDLGYYTYAFDVFPGKP